MTDEPWRPGRTDTTLNATTTRASGPEWPDILPEPFVVTILGRRGSGKTALGHRLLDVFSTDDRPAYIMGFPQEKTELLPEWIEWLPTGLTFEEWPDNSITLVNEAHHIMHARRSLDAENLELDRLVTVSRQRDADIIFDTQYARRLDLTGIMGANAIIFRYPSLMAEDFERNQMRSMVREAKSALDSYVDETDTGDWVFREETDALLRHAYVIGEKFRGEYPHEIALPDHWTEAIGKAYGDDTTTEPVVDRNTTTPGFGDGPPEDWSEQSCPHLSVGENELARLSGRYLCPECAQRLDATPTTPYDAATTS